MYDLSEDLEQVDVTSLLRSFETRHFIARFNIEACFRHIFTITNVRILSLYQNNSTLLKNM